MNSLCPTCRKMLYRTDACKGGGVECGRTDGGSKQSTAARTDVHTQEGKSVIASGVLTAGTQAPLVDDETGTSEGRSRSKGRSPVATDQYVASELLPPIQFVIVKRGRPKLHPDRKAYKAEHERKRRAKQKEGK